MSAAWQENVLAAEIGALVDYFRRPWSIAPSSGILLFGPPGVGKTYLVQEAAREAGVYLARLPLPELMAASVWERSLRIRRDITNAEQQRLTSDGHSVVFFDDFDCSIAAQCDPVLVSQVVQAIDWARAAGRKVIFVGATNRPDLLGPDVPSRLDCMFHISLLDEAARLALIRSFLRRAPLSASIDVPLIASRLGGYTTADIHGLCQHAVRTAIREHYGERPMDEMEVQMRHFDAAVTSCRPSVSAQELQAYERFAAANATPVVPRPRRLT